MKSTTADGRACNPYDAAASACWQRGEDGEVLARDLARALAWIVQEAMGTLMPTHMGEAGQPAHLERVKEAVRVEICRLLTAAGVVLTTSAAES